MRLKQPLRYELKYLLRREQVGPLLDDLRAWLRVDDHGDDRGVYPITSLYYDTPGLRAYWDKIDGQRNRRKVRVRVYGHVEVTPETPAFLEIKQRITQMMSKRRIALPYAEAVDFDAFPEMAAARPGPDGDLLQEVYYLYRMLQLRPTCVVTYDRMAFEGNEYAPDLARDAGYAGTGAHARSVVGFGRPSGQSGRHRPGLCGAGGQGELQRAWLVGESVGAPPVHVPTHQQVLSGAGEVPGHDGTTAYFCGGGVIAPVTVIPSRRRGISLL